MSGRTLRSATRTRPDFTTVAGHNIHPFRSLFPTLFTTFAPLQEDLGISVYYRGPEQELVQR